MALLAVAPTVLIGCSGGSSSNNSTTTTRADLTYSTPENPKVLNQGKVQGEFKPRSLLEGIPDYTVGNGVYAYFTASPLPPEGRGILVNNVVVNNSSENRVLTIERVTLTGAQEPVGTVYDLATQTIPISIRLERNFKTNTAPFGAFYLGNSGTLTVTSVNGNYNTLEFKNVQLVTQTGSDPATIQLNGTFTYKRSNVVLYNPGSDTATATQKKALKN